MSYRYRIKVRAGYTGRDHLLPEIARQAECVREYSSRSAAVRGGERALARVIASDDLYRGLFAGLVVEVPS